jgi:hypothetical protein
MPGGNIAAVGENWSDSAGGSDSWLLITSAGGVQVASKVYGGSGYEVAHGLANFPGGGLLLAGKASVNGNPQLWVARTDATGAVLWESVQGGSQSEEGRAVAAWPDGQVAVTGETNSYGGGVEAWLLRFDPAGNLLWDKRYAGAKNEWGSALAVLPDRGVVIGGRVFKDGDNQLDFLMIRTGPWGHAACDFIGPCGTMTAAQCEDDKACTVDLCAATTGCSHEPLKAGSPCGQGICAESGACLGG